MKFILLFLLYIPTSLALAEVTSPDAEQPFVCDPPKAIASRINNTKDCIAAMDIAIDYPTPKTVNIPGGQLFFTSVTDNDGRVKLTVWHQCDRQKQSKKKTTQFCGYQNSELDRMTPATQQIRAAINRDRHMSQKEIDEQMAKEINPWIADPLKNIVEENGKVRFTILEKQFGITCYEQKNFEYLVTCKK